MFYILFIVLICGLNVFANPARSSSNQQLPQCGGVRGYDLGIEAYSYTAKSSLATFSKCGRKCRADSRCSSFAYGAGACLLYNIPM